MDSGIRVMEWSEDFDGPWSSLAERRYVQGGFSGLSLTLAARGRLESLEFLRRFPGLRGFSINARVKDDTEAFRIETMEELALFTGSRLTVPDVVQPELSSLWTLNRPGLAVAQHWPSLERLRVGLWKDADLRLVANGSHLTSVYLEGGGQAGTLEGVESCHRLEKLTIIDCGIRDTAPLRSLDNLVEVKLMAARPAVPHARINLADICNGRLERLRIVRAAKVEGLELLAGCRRVKEVTLVDCDLSASDQAVLAALPIARRVAVR